MVERSIAHFDEKAPHLIQNLKLQGVQVRTRSVPFSIYENTGDINQPDWNLFHWYNGTEIDSFQGLDYREESAFQIKMRAERLEKNSSDCLILTETNTQNIFRNIEEVEPARPVHTQDVGVNHRMAPFLDSKTPWVRWRFSQDRKIPPAKHPSTYVICLHWDRRKAHLMHGHAALVLDLQSICEPSDDLGERAERHGADVRHRWYRLGYL